MNVTIIGAGNMGKGIGYRIAAGGHSITLVDSNPEAAENLREELHSVMRKGATISTANLEEVIPGEVVILALWYGVKTAG
jgi:3-hydroxyacyl-CoA dehydrogenase